MFMPNLLPLDYHCYGIAAPQTKRGQASAKVPVFQCMEQCYEDPRPAGPEWMTKGNCTAMDVQLLCIDIQFSCYCYGSGGIRLVVFHEVHIGYGKTCLFKQFPDRRN